MRTIYRRGKFRMLCHGWRTVHIFFNRRLSMALGYNEGWRAPCLCCKNIGLAHTLEFHAGPFMLAFVGASLERGRFWLTMDPLYFEWFGPKMLGKLKTVQSRLAEIHNLRKT